MKKILLNLVLVALALSSYGQSANVTNIPVVNTPLDHTSQLDQSKKQVNHKKTRGTRFYSYISAIDAVDYGGFGAFDASALAIWQDSTILQRFSSGYGNVNFISASGAFNPAADIYNDPAFYSGEMHITDSDPYTLDSIYITGIYMTPDNLGATPGDKIRISINTTGNNNHSYWSLGQSANAGVSSYLGSTADTSIRGLSPFGDPVGKVGGDPSLTNRVVWDYNLTNADTSMRSATGSYFWKTWGFAPPSPINVPAGERAIVTFTFFTGGTWVAGVDSITFNAGGKNHWRPRFFEEVSAARMLYRCNSERNGGDFNNSALMFSSDYTRYLPSVLIEAINTASFRSEQLDVDWVATCANCGPVAVNDLSEILEDVKVYPNPVEGGNLNINFTTASTLNNAAVNLMDMTGKVVYTQSLDKVQANSSVQEEISLDGISAGMYFFSLTSDQGKFIKKVVVK